jgi:effector-binding domain-containing protein
MKRFLLLFIVVGVALLCWYLFVRPFEYEVKFNANTTGGDIIETIRIWERAFEGSEVISVDSTFGLTQKIFLGDRSYVYTWKFKDVNDSTTRVRVQITEPGKSIANKIYVPFTSQPIEEDSKKILTQFYTILKSHLQITRVKLEGESEVGESFCVCRNVETSQTEKANGMMKDFPLLTSFISDNGLTPAGFPILRIREWNHSKGTLNFDFCFPIANKDSLPVSSLVEYKKLERVKALKAVFHGNYITSDRAWYALIKFANEKGYKHTGLPIEHFHNNPNLGWDEQKWRAEIFLPLIN